MEADHSHGEPIVMNDKSSLFVIGLAAALLLAGGACGGSLPQRTGSGGWSGSGGTGVIFDPTRFHRPRTASFRTSQAAATSSGPGTRTATAWAPTPTWSTELTGATAIANRPPREDFLPRPVLRSPGPRPGQPFPPSDVATSAMCTDGVAAMVMNKGGSPRLLRSLGRRDRARLQQPGR